MHFLFSGILAATLSGAQAPPPLQHPHESGRPPEQLGRVHFENSCRAAVAADIDRAVALLHSFWFNVAAAAFTGVAEKDPGCGIAWWGVAMSRWGNPFAPARPAAALEQGRAAIDKARAAGAKTERERAYIEAAAALFTDFATVDQRTRTVNYERAMERLYAAHRDDSETAAFYALAVNQTALPTDKTYAQQLKAAAILEPLFARTPDHPGAAHYLIHAFDHPPLAERALPAARRYARIAPDAPHALHMPSHTFTRVGFWEDSIATNIASAAAARKAGSPAETLHALDYQVYAYLQTAQDAAAKRVLGELQAIMAEVNTTEQYGQVGYYASAAIPARVALERAAWAEAASLTPRPSGFAFIDGMTYFARAIGAARGGQVAAAGADLQQLAALHAKLVAAKDDYWAQQVGIQEKGARAWVTFAEGRRDDALALLKEAAALEDSTDKSAISPGPLAPAREMLGDMLLEMKRPADALQELDAVMKKEPNRFRAIYLAARAAEASGDTARARRHFRQLVEMCPKGEPVRPELAAAKTAAGR